MLCLENCKITIYAFWRLYSEKMTCGGSLPHSWGMAILMVDLNFRNIFQFICQMVDNKCIMPMVDIKLRNKFYGVRFMSKLNHWISKKSISAQKPILWQIGAFLANSQCNINAGQEVQKHILRGEGCESIELLDWPINFIEPKESITTQCWKRLLPWLWPHFLY
jgi:hypothetical protein